LLGHVSVQTTEVYLAWKERLRGAVNDRIGIESEPRRPRARVGDYTLMRSCGISRQTVE
jgi:hypothetical protein